MKPDCLQQSIPCAKAVETNLRQSDTHVQTYLYTFITKRIKVDSTLNWTTKVEHCGVMCELLRNFYCCRKDAALSCLIDNQCLCVCIQESANIILKHQMERFLNLFDLLHASRNPSERTHRQLYKREVKLRRSLSKPSVCYIQVDQSDSLLLV